MELKKKVVLETKGQSIAIKSKDEVGGPFHATLRWKTAVDLDLHCFYKLKAQPEKASGFFGSIKQAFNGSGDQEGSVNFSAKGNKDKAPWITLDEDSGVGDTGGDNEENMHFWDIDKIEQVIIVANIYGKKTSFAKYDGVVIVSGGGKEFEVPLTEQTTGSWCVVARIDNSGASPTLHNVNITQKGEPTLQDFL
jgi:uncharacterized protein involved in tellurium resistance